MDSPTPRTALTGHCSVIRDDVLYVYSQQAFQSLPLITNGTWSTLNAGVPVSGAACVGSEDSLWVVGGIPSTDTSGYPGLQKFTYATRSWETITPVVEVTSNRQNHAAVLLAESNSILVYGGSQLANSVPTTETFLISTQSPYGVQSFSAHNVPVSSPLLLPWDNASAITVGGASDDSNIYHFQLPSGWKRIKPSLTAPLKSSAMQQATLIQGSDDSRVLQLYDLSVTPNNVTQIVLQNARGFPTKPGVTIGQPRGTKRKRDLTLRTWPTYNDTNVPTAVRSGFALARSTDGIVAISGGGDSSQSVLLFNEQQNKWVNTTAFFGASAHQKPFVPAPIQTNKPSSAPTLDSPGEHHRTMVVLGAVLGSILGFVALLIILLLFLRYKRRKLAQQRKQAQGDEDDDDDDDEKMIFVDRGDPLAKEIGGIVYPASHHSLSVHEGETGHKLNHRRSETRGSEHSQTHLVPKDKETFEMSPIRDMPPLIRPINQASTSTTSLQVPGVMPAAKRSSGWSGYFSSNSQRMSGRDSGRNTPMGESSTHRSSSATSNHDCKSHGPTELPPLDMGNQFQSDGAAAGAQENNHDLSRVSSIRESSERPRTVSSNFSRPSTARESLWSDSGHQEQSNWTPMTQTASDFTSRRPRDTGTSSFYGSNADSDARHQIYSMGPPPSFSVTASTPKIGVIAEEPHDMQQKAKEVAVRVMQAPVHEPQQATVQSDLSWVNLGTAK